MVMKKEQAKIVDADNFIEHLNEKARVNSIELRDLIVVYDGKEVKLSEKQVEFYQRTGLNNIHIVEDILEMEDCPSEFIKIVNDSFWELI